MLAGWLRLAACAPLAPLLVAQALHVRRVTPRLPEAEGERCGQLGTGPALRLLILGDSAAAGVGASHQHDALAGQLAKRLAPRYSLAWRLLATSGDRSADARRKLAAAPDAVADVVLT